MAFGKFAQYTPSEIAYNPVAFDVIKELQSLFDYVKAEDNGAHSMRFETNEPRRVILNDPDHLKFIVMNLLQNAVRYSDPGTEISLTVEGTSDTVRFTVSDEGIGIPKEELDKLYSPFFRGSNVAGRPGTGLGLAILKRSAKFAGAKIEVDSEPGRGTRFTIVLPAEKVRH